MPPNRPCIVPPGPGGHAAVIGMTESGKTYLMQRGLAPKGRAAGQRVLVLDKWKDPAWKADWMTNDLFAFIAKAKASRRCMLIVEEAGNWGREPEFEWLVTQARHWGHSTYYLSQYHAQVPPIVRVNVRRLFLFTVSADSAKVWANEFAQPEISSLCAKLPPFHFVYADKKQRPPRILSIRAPG